MKTQRKERGAVATIVVTLLGMGVVLGLLAISVDVGRLMVERRQLQNGADAAANSLALSCARGFCVAGGEGPAGTLQALTNNNARDGEHTIALQCGRNAGSLPTCPTSSYALEDCPPLPPAYASATTLPYVEVHTTTRSGGASAMRNFFSGANGNEQSTTVHACSRAAWGQPGGGTATTPITVSICEWQTMTAGGTSWVVDPPSGAWPGYGGAGQPPMPGGFTDPNTAGREQMFTLHDPAKPPCSYNGKDTAGGFGYLDPTGSCEATVTTVNGVDMWSNIDTGSSATGDCQTKLANLWANGPVIDIPVFDCIVKSTTGTPAGGIAGKDCTGGGGSGAISYYHIVGWAKFYLSGYKIGGAPATERTARAKGVVPCSGAQRCLSGWFVKGVLASAPTIVPGGPNLGSYAVVPVG